METMTVRQEMKLVAKSSIKAYKESLKIVKDQMDSMEAIPHEMNMIKAGIEGRLIGAKNYLRNLS